MKKSHYTFFIIAFSWVFSVYAETQIHMAVFSKQQTLWPQVSDHKKQGMDTLQVGVLPVHIQDYSESKPCDSCHRLSANGWEFFLENYNRDRLEKLLPQAQVQLIAPENLLLRSKMGFSLMEILDSLNFPVDAWFYHFEENLIYRPKDAITSMVLKEKLNKIGGILKLTHLLLPFKVSVQVKPLFSNEHTGGLSYQFFLLFWNVQEGRLEWVLKYEDQRSLMDLDEDLSSSLDQNLLNYLNTIPKKLVDLWSKEAH